MPGFFRPSIITPFLKMSTTPGSPSFDHTWMDLKTISTLHLTAMFCRVVFLLGLFSFYFPFPIYADLPFHPGVMPPVVAFALEFRRQYRAHRMTGSNARFVTVYHSYQTGIFSLFSEPLIYSIILYICSILTNRSPRAFARVPIPTRVNDRDTFISTCSWGVLVRPTSPL